MSTVCHSNVLAAAELVQDQSRCALQDMASQPDRMRCYNLIIRDLAAQVAQGDLVSLRRELLTVSVLVPAQVNALEAVKDDESMNESVPEDDRRWLGSGSSGEERVALPESGKTVARDEPCSAHGIVEARGRVCLR